MIKQLPHFPEDSRKYLRYFSIDLVYTHGKANVLHVLVR